MTWSKERRRSHAVARAQRRANADDLRRSALRVARLALSAPGLVAEHVDDLLHYAIWKLSEADYPKYHLPTRTKRAHKEILLGGSLQKRLRHEHVYQRAEVVRRARALAGKGSVAVALKYIEEHADACVVHKAEAAKLDKVPGFGWKRYEQFNVHEFREGELRLVRPRT